MRSPRYPVSKKGVVVIPPGDSYYAELAVLVRNVEALPDNAPITDVLKAHTELSDFVRRTARERVSYAEYVMRLEFRDGETNCALENDDRVLSGLLVDDAWGQRFRASHGSDQTLHLTLELSLRDLCWALSMCQPRSRLAFLGEKLLDDLRADMERHQTRAALWADSNVPEPGEARDVVDPDRKIGWVELPTEFVHWRFAKDPDVDYWTLRNRLLVAVLDSDRLGYIDDLLGAVTRALPTSVSEFIANPVHPRDLIENQLSEAGYLEVPFSVPGPDTFPLHVPDYVDQLRDYETELTGYVQSVVEKCTEWMRLNQIRASSTSLRQLWRLGLPEDGPRR